MSINWRQDGRTKSIYKKYNINLNGKDTFVYVLKFNNSRGNKRY